MLTGELHRDRVGRQFRPSLPLDRLPHPPVVLRVRDGSADLHADAADHRALGHAVLLVPGPRLDETRGLGQDPRGDDHPLSAEVRRRHHREEEGGGAGGVSAGGGYRVAPASTNPSTGTSRRATGSTPRLSVSSATAPSSAGPAGAMEQTGGAPRPYRAIRTSAPGH